MGIRQKHTPTTQRGHRKSCHIANLNEKGSSLILRYLLYLICGLLPEIRERSQILLSAARARFGGWRVGDR
jgi:hypothetical protein